MRKPPGLLPISLVFGMLGIGLIYEATSGNFERPRHELTQNGELNRDAVRVPYVEGEERPTIEGEKRQTATVYSKFCNGFYDGVHYSFGDGEDAFYLFEKPLRRYDAFEETIQALESQGINPNSVRIEFQDCGPRMDYRVA